MKGGAEGQGGLHSSLQKEKKSICLVGILNDKYECCVLLSQCG